VTEPKTRTRSLLIAAVATVLVVVVGVTIYAGRMAQGERAKEAERQMEEGIAQFHQKQYEQSLATLGAIPEDVFRHWRVHYYKGSALINLKDFSSAATELEQALELKPDEPRVLFALGVVYYRLNNPSVSKAYFGKVLEIEPGNEDARGLMDIMATIERQIEDGTIPGPEAAKAPSHGDPDSGR
jgi:tetratricopeptide (TPR) repeat protein